MYPTAKKTDVTIIVQCNELKVVNVIIAVDAKSIKARKRMSNITRSGYSYGTAKNSVTVLGSSIPNIIKKRLVSSLSHLVICLRLRSRKNSKRAGILNEIAQTTESRKGSDFIESYIGNLLFSLPPTNCNPTILGTNSNTEPMMQMEKSREEYKYLSRSILWRKNGQNERSTHNH